LYGITASAANDVWAVGYSQDPDTSGALTLVEHWDGTSWTIISSPNAPPPDPGVVTTDFALGITAVSANDVWMVGSYCDGPNGICFTLTEQWDGTQWSIVPSPNATDFGFNTLESVTAVAPNDIWAVGNYSGVSGPEVTLIEHWDGSGWSIDSSPGSLTLHTVAAASASDVWAAGASGSGEALIEHWDGSQWSSIASPTLPLSQVDIYGLAAISSSNVWAVGSDCPNTGGSCQPPLIEHWDGTNWTVVAGAPNQDDGVFRGVVAIAINDVWAVGSPIELYS
jgi:hypothetical protein